MEYQRQQSPPVDPSREESDVTNEVQKKQLTDTEAASEEAAELVEKLEYFKVGIFQFTSTYPTLLNTGSRGKSVHLKDSCDKAGGIISIHFDIMILIKRLNQLPLFLSPDLIHCLECWCPLLILPDGNPRIVKAVAGGGGAHLGGGALETHLGQVSQGKLRDLCTFENLWSLLCPPSMICANYHLPLTLENAGLPWGERYLQVRFAT